ncbi:MAG: superfamily II DNA or RNA helicase [Verrucomicrobiales bacterium]|jgi:superfamily II DNA or RNA helicase
MHNVAIGILGPDLRPSLDERTARHSLYPGLLQPPVEAIDVVAIEPKPLVDLLIRRSGGASWSPSLAWIHQATQSAIDIASSGRVVPALRTAGLRWRADWNPLKDATVDDVVSALTAVCPPVVLAASDKPANNQVSGILNTLIDAVCRVALIEEDWRPPLPRTRASNVVALRRITTALSRADAVFVADSVAHESAFAEWSTQLSEFASVIVGAPEVVLQGRLEPPAEDMGGSWSLQLEIVHPSGKTLGFNDVWQASGAALELAEEESLAPLRTRMRELIDRLASQLASFAPLADEPEPAELLLHVDEVSDLLTDGLEACRLAGLPIVTPTGLLARSARLTARASSSSGFGGSWGLGAAVINVDWGLALGDISLTQEEIEALARSNADLVALRGSWVQIDHHQMRAALNRLDTQRRDSSELSPAELLRQTISELEQDEDNDLTAEGWIKELLEGLPEDQLTEALEPPGFIGELRPYQRRALGWLQFLGRLGLGGCLADDMGLGKTPTALAYLLGRKLDRVTNDLPRLPHLVICPLSVVTNWEAEAERFTPELSVMIAHGPDRLRGPRLVRAAAEHDIIITTYGTASRIADELDPIQWDVVVCDEAQAIKNHRTNAAISIRSLRSTQRIALTGTPVENRLTELWAILDALNPGMLGGITWFRETFSNPIESGDGADALESLRRLTAPFVLRRTKLDRSLVPDLPDKIEQVAWAPLTPEQAGLYQAVVDDFLTNASASTGMERRGLVLATLTKLKQVCNHPAHFLRDDTVGEANRSGKLERFDELLETMLESGERALVFTQYREMGKLLAHHVESRFGFPAPFLHGGTTRTQRKNMVDAFQAPDGAPVQLISLRAGGTGLNLTAASRVIHYDRWWNPAVEDQATDRSWRIGQDKTVFVHKLVCRGTLEQRIDTLLTEKRALANAVVGTDESWLTELSTDELRELLRLDPSAHTATSEWEQE